MSRTMHSNERMDRGHGHVSRGAALLEVLLALALFVGAAAVLGSALQSSLRSAQMIRIDTVAVDLATSVLSEIQLGQKPMRQARPRRFEPPLDEWTWQTDYEPAGGRLDLLGLWRVQVEVTYRPDGTRFRLGQLIRDPASVTLPEPEEEEEEEFDTLPGAGEESTLEGGEESAVEGGEESTEDTGNPE